LAVPKQLSGRGPSVARTARLQIVAGDFDAARAAIDRIVAELQGVTQQVDVSNAGATPRTLNATLLIPSKDLETAIGRLRAVGQVTNESQGGEDVSDQLVDLDARLSNARNTEKRLVELLRDRTGKLSDVLEAEREVARVREEIERTDAQRQQLDRRVVYATVSLQLSEQPKAAIDLGPLPISLQLKNAFVDGLESAVGSALSAAFLVARAGPVLILWGAIFAWPIRILMRRQRVRA
jgi:hypothetical protein